MSPNRPNATARGWSYSNGPVGSGVESAAAGRSISWSAEGGADRQARVRHRGNREQVVLATKVGGGRGAVRYSMNELWSCSAMDLARPALNGTSYQRGMVTVETVS